VENPENGRDLIIFIKYLPVSPQIPPCGKPLQKEVLVEKFSTGFPQGKVFSLEVFGRITRFSTGGCGKPVNKGVGFPQGRGFPQFIHRVFHRLSTA
jgi:hypothetical protein